MRRLIGLSAAIVVAVSSTVASGHAASSSPQCGDVISSDVVLTADLICPAGALTIPGFVDVTLDLNGHSIIGSGSGTGVSISPSLQEDPLQSTPGHVTVKNGSVRGFQIGVAVVPTFVHGDDSVQLDQLSIRDNGVGFSGFQGRGVATTLANSTIANNRGTGVGVSHFLPFQMINDQVTGNGGDGILAGDQDGLRLLQGSFIAHNAGAGARIESSLANISGNTFLGNAGTGLSIEESSCSLFPFYVVSDNIANQNGGGGMSMVPRSCSPVPAPPSGSGNVAKNNAVFQCILIVCARNLGQAKKNKG